MLKLPKRKLFLFFFFFKSGDTVRNKQAPRGNLIDGLFLPILVGCGCFSNGAPSAR